MNSVCDERCSTSTASLSEFMLHMLVPFAKERVMHLFLLINLHSFPSSLISYCLLVVVQILNECTVLWDLLG